MGVQALGFGGVGFGDLGLGLGFRIRDSGVQGFRASGLGLGFWGWRFRVRVHLRGFGFSVQSLRFRGFGD